MSGRPDAAHTPSVLLRDVSFRYGRRVVVDQVDLAASGRQTVGIVGPNGSGKSTLLKLVNGTLTPASGTVEVAGQPIAGLRRREVARLLATVAQADSAEIPFSVAHTVLQGRLPHVATMGSFSHRDREIAAAALVRADVHELADRSWQALSGGEQRRVLIARALAQQAPILLLDEPTNHLDLFHQHRLLGMLGSLEALVLVVLHDLNLAARYCDRIVLLDRGRVVAAGTPPDVLRPSLLEPVYGVAVHPHALHDVPQLLFAPRKGA